MAGIARPGDDILIGSGIECTDYEIFGFNCVEQTSPYGLFDGTTPWNDYYSPRVCYMNNNSHFDIKFNKCVNIYRCGSNWPEYYSKCRILRLNELSNKYESVNVIQNLSPLKTTQWELYIENLQPGYYRFAGYDLRIDSEWFLEYVPLYILKSNSKYYSIKPEYYNTGTKMYDPIDIKNKDFESFDFSTNDLFIPLTIAGETFCPIDKFDKFSIVSLVNKKMTIKGTKTKSELIVANEDIDASIAENIHNFTLIAATTNTNIKIAMSLDGGKTWGTCSNNILTPLDIKIPLSNFENQSKEQQEDWENAKKNILQNGIDINTFNSLDFNNLTDKLYKIRFAYVVFKDDYDDLAELDSLQWNFDAKGIMRKMKNNEYNVHTYKNSVIVTPLIKSQILNTQFLI